MMSATTPGREPPTGRAQRWLARLSFVRAQFEQSEALYEQALHLGKRALGSESLEVAQALNGLGITYEMLLSFLSDLTGDTAR